MDEKIKQINSLDFRIRNLKEFLDVCVRGGTESKYKDHKGNPKKNYFHELGIGAHVWTGTHNPPYIKRINQSEDIDILVEAMKESVREQINKLTNELKDILK